MGSSPIRRTNERNIMAVEATVANGYPLGRPENREPHPLDKVVRRAIEKLPMETRLYPDVYAWSITDAVQRASKPQPLSDEDIIAIFNDRTLGAPIDRLREISRRSAEA